MVLTGVRFIRRRQNTPWLIKPGDEWRGEPGEALAKTGFGYGVISRYNGFKAVVRFISMIIPAKLAQFRSVSIFWMVSR